jgi:serine/threonine protein kinase
MEYCGGGSCADLLRPFGCLKEEHIAFIMRSCLKGLAYIHSEKKIHRDIKAENILITYKGEVKLADFGVSSQLTYTMTRKRTFVGTPFWMAPEVITTSEGYNCKADIWSLGITALELALGSPPYCDLKPTAAIFKIVENDPPQLPQFAKAPSYSYGKQQQQHHQQLKVTFTNEFREFVNLALMKDSLLRASAEILLESRFIRLTYRRSGLNLLTLLQPKKRFDEVEKQKLKLGMDREKKKLEKKKIEIADDNNNNNNNLHSKKPKQNIIVHNVDHHHPPHHLSADSDVIMTDWDFEDNNNTEENEYISTYKRMTMHLNHQFEFTKNTTNQQAGQVFQHILLKAFERVEYRANRSSAKAITRNLSAMFVEGEKKVPGLGGAFVEEMWVVLCALKKEQGI